VVGVQQGASDPLTERRQEGEGHPPADDQRVDLGCQRLEDLDLVGDLGPPDDGHERPRRAFEDASQHLDLAGHADPGRARQELRWTDDRGVAPVRHTEGLVHVGIETLDEGGHEHRVVALLAGVEPQVLTQLDAGAECGQPLPHRVHLPPGVPGGGGAPQVRAGHHLGTAVLQPAQRGQRGRDPEVVGHRGPAVDPDVEGHVEVDPHQHASAVELRKIREQRQPAQWVHPVSSLPAP